MNEWVLILLIYAGFPSGSVTMFAVDGFRNKEACTTAGKAAEPIANSTFKPLRFVCVKR